MIVSTVTALAACLAVAGNTCSLDPTATWGDVLVQDIHNADAASVLDATGVALNSVALRRVSYITLTGGMFAAPVDHQIMVGDSDHVAVLHTNHANAVRNAISCSVSTDFTISFNTITAGQNDGIAVGGCARGVVSYNTIGGTIRAPGNHADGIQLWSEIDHQPHDILIAHNDVSGETMGIGMHHSPAGAVNQAYDLHVTDNRVDVMLSNGISFSNCFRCRLARNTVITMPGGVTITGEPSTPAKIRLSGGSWVTIDNTADGAPAP